MAIQLLRSCRRALDIGIPETLLGREKECIEITSFLKGHLCDETGGSIYISGSPGTGKSACVKLLLDKINDSHLVSITYINCMDLHLSSSRKLLAYLLKQFGLGSLTTEVAARKRLQRFFKTKPIVLALDEVDQLQQSDLYPLFEWPSLDGSKLVLVTIANALDFTESALPRMRTMQCKIDVLHFAPYRNEQLVHIVTHRLSTVDQGIVLFEQSALEFCARKVASFAGDARKMLSICSTALEHLETELKPSRVLQLSSVPNSSSIPIGSIRKISIIDIDRIFKSVYGSKVDKLCSKPTSSKENKPSVPLQQKLVMCALFRLVKDKKCKDSALPAVYAQYAKICDKQNISTVDKSEVLGMCGLLESNGLIALRKEKKTGQTVIRLRIDEKELSHVIANSELLSLIVKE